MLDYMVDQPIPADNDYGVGLTEGLTKLAAGNLRRIHPSGTQAQGGKQRFKFFDATRA
jgi:hypothetical protein